MSESLKFTIIIPTRERCDTLKWTLKTCVEQDYDNLEIIVSDNFSQDDTKRVVESYKDNRICYINTGKRVSMTENFEFALNYATGDYVSYIGDDDGFMPDSISELNEICQEISAEAITWGKPVYGWKNLPNAAKNSLTISLKKNELIKIDAKERLKKVLSFNTPELCYWNLIWLYHGFVKRERLLELRSITGQFFNSINPDVYAAVALSCVLPYFWQSSKSFTIAGVSHHSTSGWTTGETKNVNTFYQENTIPFHKNIKKAFSASIYTAEAFMQAREIVPEAKNFNVNIEGLIENSLKAATTALPQNYESVVESVRHLGKVYNLEEFAEEQIARNPNQPLIQNFMLTGYNFLRNELLLKLDEDKVQNVFDASLICRDIIKNDSYSMYAIESGRFLLSATKNYGFTESIKKVMKYIREN